MSFLPFTRVCSLTVLWATKVIAPVSETINPDFAEGVSDPVELRSTCASFTVILPLRACRDGVPVCPELMLSEISAFHVERQSLFEREQAVASASH
jgi:hypothetical protein